MIHYFSVLVLFFTDMVTTMKEKLVHIVLPTPINVEESHSLVDRSTWEDLMVDYGLPFGGYCAGMIYTLYLRMSLANIGIFMLKYFPMVIYLYKLVKDVFIASRKRIKFKQFEIEAIQEQIADYDTKLVDRKASLDTLARTVRVAAERLRRVRARVRALIATDDTLKHVLDMAARSEEDVQHVAGDDQELLNDLLKEFQCVQLHRQTSKECGEPSDATPEDSVYSAARSDDGNNSDCHVKIVKVTNAYKVAYLRHYIKQKRQRRATKQALLKSKVESVKNLFDDWQKALNMVINTKLSTWTYNMNNAHLDDASHEAMGDFSKPNLCSDSDNELRPNEAYFDERWNDNSNYTYEYDEAPDSPRELYDVQECEVRVPSPRYPCACSRAVNTNMLCAVTEETNSQIAMEESKTDKEDED